MKQYSRTCAGALMAVALCFAAAPAWAAWDRFEIIHWQTRDAAQLETLRRLGVTAVTVIPARGVLDQEIAAPSALGLRWYLENVATDFYAPYHKYTPGKIENWRFLEAQERYRANPEDTAALHREPSLSDPEARARIAARLTDLAARQKAFRPLYYSLGDETGIADLAAFWDFDLSPASVAGFRAWLRTQYGSLDALNAEWGSSWPAWEAIEPETTRLAMRRTDGNFAAWNDFKAWMDTSFAEALRFGTDALHRADPTALAGIEGTQIPGWGGYDYTKLAQAVDVVEIYDDGENLPILRSLNPGVTALITSGAATPEALHGLWREVLRGARGLILWDEDNSIVTPGAEPGARGQAYAPVFAALRGPLGQRLVEAETLYDPVAILYSPVSFRVRWMLDHQPNGDAWMSRSAEIELGDNAFRVALREYAAAVRRFGLTPRFISPGQLAKGPPEARLLILPHTLALSEEEVRAIAAFAARGGTVVSDIAPGAYDEHGRPRPATPVLPVARVTPRALTAPAAPAFAVDSPDNDVDTYMFVSRGKRLLALHRRAPGGAVGPVTVYMHGSRASDVVTGQDHAASELLTLMLDPVTPIVLEIDP